MADNFYKPNLGAFRFQTFTRIGQDTECDPNTWLIDRSHPNYIAIATADGLLIDEVDVTNHAQLTDLALICYAVGWMMSCVQGEVV